MSDREAISRVAKILARAGSDNQNEATAALEGAYKRMVIASSFGCIGESAKRFCNARLRRGGVPKSLTSWPKTYGPSSQI